LADRRCPGCGVLKPVRKLTLTAANAYRGTNIVAEGSLAHTVNTAL
jgi:hypothetical protein